MSEHGWDTALDAQTDLIASFMTKAGREYLDGFIERLGEAGVIDSRTGLEAIAEDGNNEFAHRLVNVCVNELQHCEPFFVSEELTDLIDWVSEDFKPEVLLATDLMVPNGFAYFDTPLYMKRNFVPGDVVKMPFRAIQWFHGRENERPEDGSWVIVALYSHGKDPDPEDGGQRQPKIGPSDLAMEYATVLRFGQDPAVYQTDTNIADMFAHLKVFWRLCQQTIAIPTQTPVSRPVWKRARKWRPVRQIVVFTLRRAKGKRYEGEEREVQWTHRWFVSAHWRNQPYVEKDADGNKVTVYRQILIQPYLKGPDDKPIVYKRRAFELIR
jgi:hypothetical protein